ncbi:MAG: transketolase [Candidatus Aenigmarchaeota archaeon]|nr:transketolase [Candidatus Aenigmarchaeota archaeon]
MFKAFNSLGFRAKKIDSELMEQLYKNSDQIKADTLISTFIAKTGHPEGSMSASKMLACLYAFSNINPRNSLDINRDRIVVEGHYAPAVYSVLGRSKYFPIGDYLTSLRKYRSIFEGHLDRSVPGVDCDTGVIGHPLSWAVGFAEAGKLKGMDYHVYALLGDGGHDKGQLHEARKTAKKRKLDNLTCIYDVNDIQISGHTSEIAGFKSKKEFIGFLRKEFGSCGWKTLEVDGTDIESIYEGLREARRSRRPTFIASNSLGGEGVKGMENTTKYHGQVLKTSEECMEALRQLGLENEYDIEKLEAGRKSIPKKKIQRFFPYKVDYSPRRIDVVIGEPDIEYAAGNYSLRERYGKTLLDLGGLNEGKIIVLSNDLAGSTKIDMFAEKFPEYFIECGIMENNTCEVAGALSLEGLIPFVSTFVKFGTGDSYSSHVINELNRGNSKMVHTHMSIVGPDGKSHNATDFLAIMRSLFNYKIIAPADINQTDHVIRYIAKETGNCFVALPRENLPLILKEDGKPAFDENYNFFYGKDELLRDGRDGTIFAFGPMVHRALEVKKIVEEKTDYTIAVVNKSCPTQIHEDSMISAFKRGPIFSYEPHSSEGGMGTTLAEYVGKRGLGCNWKRFEKKAPVKKFALEGYTYSDEVDVVYEEKGLDAKRVAMEIKKYLEV